MLLSKPAQSSCDVEEYPLVDKLNWAAYTIDANSYLMPINFSVYAPSTLAWARRENG